MYEKALAWNWFAAGMVALFSAVMAVIGGRRYHSKTGLDVDDETADSSSLQAKYTRLNERWRRSKAYLVWVYTFALIVGLSALWFLWKGWSQLQV
jgi:membrane protein implicated in regulation of membrane protease activity